MPTLPEFIAVERDQCRALVQDFDRLGSTGAFGAALIQDAVGRAEAAVRGGLPQDMHCALDELRRVAALRCTTPRRASVMSATNSQPVSRYAYASAH